MWTFVPNNIKGYVYMRGTYASVLFRTVDKLFLLPSYFFMIRLNLTSDTIEDKVFC